MHLRILVFLFFTGFAIGQIADKYCMLKWKEHYYNHGLSFFWAWQPSLDACKNLCIIRKDCISIDYDPDAKMCKLFGPNGVDFLHPVPAGTKTPNVDAYIKYPTNDCNDNTPLDKWLETKNKITNADGLAYGLQLQSSIAATYRIMSPKLRFEW